MRILIAGVTGYIGGALAAELINAGHEVVGTSRNPQRARQKVPGLANAFAWNATAEPLPAEALEGVDAVALFIGESVVGLWTGAKKQRLYDSRVTVTQNAVKGIAAVEQRPGVLLSGSAYGYYGDRGDDQLVEGSGPGADFIANLCRDWEAAAMEAESLGVRVVISRTGTVVGRGAPFFKPLLPFFKFGLGVRFGSGKQWMPWVHIEDVSSLQRFVIEHDSVRGPVNVNAPNPVRQKEFANTLGKVLGRPVFLWAPAVVLKVVLGGLSGEVLKSLRMQSDKAQEAGYTFKYTELEPALRVALDR